jgi:hypothetical protein
VPIPVGHQPTLLEPLYEPIGIGSKPKLSLRTARQRLPSSWPYLLCHKTLTPRCNRLAPSDDGDRTPGHQSTGRGVALKYPQEPRIDSNLMTLFRLPTELIGPLRECLFPLLT